MEAAGAEVVVVDFPAVSNYEGDRSGCPTLKTRGLVSPEYLKAEIVGLSVWAWDDFLHANGDPNLNRISQVDGARIFPAPPRPAACPTASPALTTTLLTTPPMPAPNLPPTSATFRIWRLACGGWRRPAALILTLGWTVWVLTPWSSRPWQT